jgi:hypothetical protein
MSGMTTARDEARNPDTSPERLQELINLPGNRGDIDSDSGWCREYVAANPSAPLQILQELAADQDDFMARLGVANNPSAPADLVETLVDDRNDIVANAARERLGRPALPRPGLRIAGGRFPVNGERP